MGMEKEISFQNELFNRCKNGDQLSQFKVYKMYYKAMYNTSLRIVNNAEEAEDVMQEAFLSAFRNMEGFSGNVTFGAWLKRIVINQSIDYVRRKRPQTVVIEEINEQFVDDSYEKDDNENGEGVAEKVLRIKRAIQHLPEGYRIILSLYLLEGYDHEEIGTIMGISSSTSRSQFTRARKKLINILSSES